MSELRQNIITRDWVIIATERAKRPNHIASEHTPPPKAPPFESTCPFCPGNEHLTSKEFFRVSDGDHWIVRIVANKYPALVPEGDRVRNVDGIYRSMTGVGSHEVVIEHRRHDMTTAFYTVQELAAVLSGYRHRYQEMRNDPRIEAVIIFKNHGEGAGTSIVHPHSQIAATPVVPAQIRNRVEEAIRYFDDTGECVFCRTLRQELTERERIVFESNHFVAFIPYAALSPFHLWIFPRRHTSSFDEIFDAELNDLALNLRTVLKKLYVGLNNPDYNYSIRSIPTHDRQTDYFHWYVTIIPRVSRAAGFELGSGMFINTTIPEASAAYLRDITLPEAD